MPRCRPFLCILVLVVVAATAVTDATLFPISTSSYPHLFVKAPARTPVIWHSKAFAFELAQSVAVRIGPRGIRFIPLSHTLAFDEGSSWTSEPCLPSRECLCTRSSSSSSGNRASSRAFPNYPFPAYVTYNSSSSVSSSSCPETFTGRTLVLLPFPGSEDVHENDDDDLSLCNVIGGGTEFVYVPSRNVLYASTNPIPVLPMIVASVLAILLMMIIGYNLQSILSSGSSSSSSSSQQQKTQTTTLWNSTSHQLTLASMVALVLTSWLSNSSPSSTSPLSCFVTREDRIAFILTTVYVGYYVLRITWNLTVEPWLMARSSILLSDPDGAAAAAAAAPPRPVNAVLACLSVAVQRIYVSVDNPYTLVLAFLMLAWTFHKISMHERRDPQDRASSLLRSLYWLDVIFDCATISVMLYYGDVVQPESDPSITATLVLQAILAAAVFNRALISIHYAPEAAEMMQAAATSSAVR